MAQGTTKGVPIDIDPTLAADSDLLVPSQKAVKAYAQPQLNGTGFVKATGTTISFDNSTYTPDSRNLTINGVTYDLSANRTWLVGTVTSVAALTLGTTGTDLSSTVANGTTTPVITLNVPTASALNRGALSSSDWTTFNSKVSTTLSISTSSPLSGGGDLSANRTISIADAAADGTTKGAATFTANDFDSLAGVISLDYANGQSASASNKGFLSAADWSTFNAKQDNIEKIILTGVNQTTTANTAQDITGLVTSSLTANKNYSFHGTIRTTCSGAGGVRFAISLPSGATGRVSIIGLQVPATSTSLAFSGSVGSLSGASFAQSGTTSLFIYGRITMGSTVGAVQFQFASQTSGQTSTIVHSGETFLTLIKMD